MNGRAVRFGMFELDLRARELRKGGLGLKLDPKPLQLLELLLRRAGELVTRKELRETLWPDSFVEFDRSINTAVNKLRKVLGDRPESPRYIETRSRLGYRFIAPVDTADGAQQRLEPALVSQEPQDIHNFHLICDLMTIAAIWVKEFRRKKPEPST